MNQVVNGKREGIWKDYYENGNKRYECFYLNNRNNWTFRQSKLDDKSILTIKLKNFKWII